MNKSKNILVIGDIILDKFVYGKVIKVSQEAPVPVFNKSLSNYRLGGAANVAVNLESLNCKAILIGLFGQDKEINKKTLSLIKKNNISFVKILDRDYTIPVKSRFFSNNQQIFRVDKEYPNKKDYSDLIIKKLEMLINRFEIVILSDYDKGILNKSNKIIEYLKSKKKIILVDPKSSDFKKYKGSYLIKPNRYEMEKVINKSSISSHFNNLVKKEIIKNKIKYILLTLGEDGMTLYDNRNKFKVQNILKPNIYDVTGAGDTVIATLACFLNMNYSLKNAVEMSNLAGNIVVSKNETATVTIEDLFDKNFDISKKTSKILDQKYLLQSIRAMANKKIVFTNGCFDILHSGHIHLLKQAKKLGDLLIVGINSDKSVSFLKGKNRPINKISERLSILNSIEFIDYLVVFNEKTPIELIKTIKPSIIVKGSDYKKNQVVGFDFIKKYGGDVKIIKKVGKLSTTLKIKKINKK